MKQLVNRYLFKGFVGYLIVSLVLYLAPVPFAYANPQGGQVSAGNAAISTSGKTETINQKSQSAVIDWQQFNINGDEATKFNQPSNASLTVNRVHDMDPSKILGTLSANGNIVLINPNGVFFGKGSKVDVNGLVATTSDVKNAEVMAGRGMHFTPGSNSNATVENQGTITAKDAGLVGLVAPQVKNSGVITAKLGQVQLASGDLFTLDFYGDGLMEFGVSDSVSKQLVKNSGTINAAGGTIALTAAAGRKVVNSLLSVEGELRAPAVAAKNGHIMIYDANKGNSTVLIKAKLDASGKNAGETGGEIDILGDGIAILEGSYLDASGASGGGNIKIGGDFHGGGTTPTASATVVQNNTTIDASALDAGNGGTVAVWSDNHTTFAGTILAKGGPNGGNGGFVETSGKQILNMQGMVDASAAKGQAGTWLMDPYDVTIGTTDDGRMTSDNGNPSQTFSPNATGNISHTTVENALETGTSVIITTGSNGSPGSDNGDITVNSTINYNGTGVVGTPTLTLSAYRNIIINSGSGIVATNGPLNIVLNSDNGGNGSGAIYVAANITSNGGNITMGGGSGTISAGSGYAVGDAASNSGIRISAAIINAGTGNIIMNGQGYASSAAWDGIDIINSSTIETTGNGNITMTGVGQNLASTAGIYVPNGSTISAVDGTITLTGLNQAAVADYGLDFQATVSTSGNGNIVLTGTGGSGAIWTNAISTIGGSSETGNISFIADNLVFGFPTIKTTGNVTFAPYSANTTIGVNGGSGTLQITSGVLGSVSSESGITIGRSDGTGALTVGNLTLPVNTTILSGSGPVQFTGTVDGDYNLTVTAGTMSFGGDIGGTTPLSAVTLTSTNSLTLPSIYASSISATTTGASADITAGILAANGAGGITLNSGRDLDLAYSELDTSTGNGPVSLAAGRDAYLNAINTGTGNLTVNANNVYLYDNPINPDTGSEVAYYNFNEGSGTTATDGSGNGNNGTINGATYSTSVPSALKGDPYSLSFNGTSNYVSAPTLAGLSTTQTVFMWINPSSFSVGMNQYLFDEGSNNHQLQLYDSSNDGKPRIAWNGQLGTTELPTANTWYNIVVVAHSNGAESIYINGVLDASLNGAAPTPSTITVGRYGGGGYLYSGLIDDTRIYNTALSASDISRLYGATPTWSVGTANITATNSINLGLGGATLTTAAGKNVTMTAGGSITNTSAGTIAASQSAGSGGNVTLDADSLSFSTAPTITTTGNVTLAPHTASTTIGVSGGAGTLGITSAVLSNIAAGSLTIGRTDGTGNIDVGAQTVPANELIQTSSGNIEFAGAQTLGTKTLTAKTASGNIQLDQSAGITSTANAGNSIVLAAGGNFINNDTNDGANALAAGTGTARYLVYSTTPGSNTMGGLSDTGAHHEWHLN